MYFNCLAVIPLIHSAFSKSPGTLLARCVHVSGFSQSGLSPATRNSFDLTVDNRRGDCAALKHTHTHTHAHTISHSSNPLEGTPESHSPTYYTFAQLPTDFAVVIVLVEPFSQLACSCRSRPLWFVPSPLPVWLFLD